MNTFTCKENSIIETFSLDNKNNKVPVEMTNNNEKTRLNVNQKIEIVNYALSNPKVTHKMVAAKFAKEYGMKQISKQTMSRIMDKDMVNKLLKLTITDDSSIKNIREVLHPQLERCLFVWFSQVQHDIITIDKILIEKAKEFGEMLGICDQSFKYSQGWLEKFKNRHGIKLKKLAEAGSVDMAVVQCEREREIFEMVTDKENKDNEEEELYENYTEPPKGNYF